MSWVAQDTTLAFRVGVVSLFEAPLRTLVQTEHFTALAPAVTEQAPRAELAAAAREVAFIPSCPLPAAAPSLSLADGWVRYVARRHPHYYVEVDGDFDSYLQRHVSKRSRKTLRRLERRFRRQGDARLREYRRAAELERFLPLARRLSRRTYQERLLQRGIPRTTEFQRRTMALARADRCRGLLLFIGDRPVAYDYCEIDPGGTIMVIEHGGYDPAYERWSPGTLLDYLLLQGSFAERQIRIVDFGEGEGAYKARFATGQAPCATVYFFRPTPRHLAIFGGHLLLHRGYARGRDLAAELGLLEPIRRTAKLLAANR